MFPVRGGGGDFPRQIPEVGMSPSGRHVPTTEAIVKNRVSEELQRPEQKEARLRGKRAA